MASETSGIVELTYGRRGRFRYQPNGGPVIAARTVPPPHPRLVERIRRSLECPLEFPPLEQAVVPGDRVALVVDRHTPEASCLVAEVWRILARREINPEDVIIIQPVSLGRTSLPDPREQLAPEVRGRVRWKVHDPTAEADRVYLASTAGGERIYLSRDVVEADFVVSIGQIAFDPLIGYRGTSSVFYPGLSSTDAIARSRGQGHSELSPDDDRPLRQMMDEIAWLLGVQFSVQVIASAGSGASTVLAGAAESVLRRGKEILASQWTVQLDGRPDIVVAAVESDAAGHDWAQLGAALETARNLVAAGGKIVVLSELDAEPDQGIRLVRECQSPRDAIKPLRKLAPPDLVAATQLAAAVDWANVYLLSRLDGDFVEDLFMMPLDNEGEVERLLGGDESRAFVGGAQHVFARIRAE